MFYWWCQDIDSGSFTTELEVFGCCEDDVVLDEDNSLFESDDDDDDGVVIFKRMVGKKTKLKNK